MKVKIYLLLLLVLMSWCTAVQSQELPRRSFLGVRLEPVTDDVARLRNLPEVRGVLVAEVIPNSSAAAAGFQPGDVLLSLNGQPVNATAEVVAMAGAATEGVAFSYELLRDGKTVKGDSHFSGYPRERFADLEVEYTQASTPLGVQRLIVTKTNRGSGRQPVVVFLGGYGCYSFDTPTDTLRGETQLTNALARAGYLVARVDKPGVGDARATSTPCGEVSFRGEASGYTAAIRQLKQRADVDSTAIYLFGHSMGGVMAPLVAQQTPVKGIVAYGTIGANFLEYLLKTRRTIAAAYEMSPDSTDAFIKIAGECAAYYFVDGLSTQEAAAKKPACAQWLEVFDERSRAYNDELYALNIPAEWKSFTGRALFLWGEGDYIAAREDHEILAAAVNHYRPGHAEVRLVPNANHGFAWVENWQQARRDPGPYNPAVHRTVLEWLDKVQG